MALGGAGLERPVVDGGRGKGTRLPTSAVTTIAAALDVVVEW